MDVDQAIRVAAHEGGAEDAHETREHHDVRRVRVDLFGQCCVESFAIRESAVIDNGGGDATRSGELQAPPRRRGC